MIRNIFKNIKKEKKKDRGNKSLKTIIAIFIRNKKRLKTFSSQGF